MLWTLVRRATPPDVARIVSQLLPNKLPPSLNLKQSGNLYEVLSRKPSGGVGQKVHQLRWSGKQIGQSFWVITKSQFKCEGRHGKAWGNLYWKGKLVTRRPERIRGSLKYEWAEGRSQGDIGKFTGKVVA